MRVLHLMPYSPEPPVFGGALRIHHILEYLARHHEVTVICFAQEDAREIIRKSFGERLKNVITVPFPWFALHKRAGQFISYWGTTSYIQLVCRSKEMQNAIDRVFAESDIDIVQAEFCMMGGYAIPPGVARVLDAHNVEYDTCRRMAVHAPTWPRRRHYEREYGKLLREELATCRMHDAVFVTSDRDKQILDCDVPQVPKYVVPNGVDTSYFCPEPESPEPYSLVFTGMMGYMPNYDGMLWFLGGVLPLIRQQIPGVTMRIVGSLPPRRLLQHAGPQVTVTGYVEDVRPYVRRSSVYVVPLRMGGGTRLKVLEAMAMQKPVVTTSVGCEGIAVQDGEHVAIADDPRQFADTVVALLRNRAHRERIAQAGHQFVRANYEWSVVVPVIGRVYERLVRPKTRPRFIPAESQRA